MVGLIAIKDRMDKKPVGWTLTFKAAFAFLVKITRNSNNNKRIKRKVVSYVDENFKSGFEVDFTFICV